MTAVVVDESAIDTANIPVAETVEEEKPLTKKEKKAAKKAAKKAKKEEKKAAKLEKKAAKQAEKDAAAAAELRAQRIQDAQENGNRLTMAMLGMKHLTGCDVEIVSDSDELTAVLSNVFFDAGAENVEKRDK